MPHPSDYQELTGAPFDARCIESLWVSCASSAGVHRVLPDGRMDLIVRFRLDARAHIIERRLIVTGPATRYADIPVAQADRFIGIRFQPGWGGACLGVAPGSLRDAVLLDTDATALLGDEEAGGLMEAKTEATLQTRLLTLAQQRALGACGMADGVAAAIEQMHAQYTPLPLPALATAAGIGARSLRCHIADRVGLTFSALTAVLRFQRAIRMLATCTPVTLAHVAAECGYSDQAHMTRAFVQHGGFTPGDRLPVTLVGMPLDGLAAIFNRP